MLNVRSDALYAGDSSQVMLLGLLLDPATAFERVETGI
jgi:hypothetical protein